MTFKIGEPFFQRANVLVREVCTGDTAMHFQRPHCGHHHCCRRRKTSRAALDVEEFFRTKVCAKAGFCYHIISEAQRRCGCNNGIAAMGDVRKRAAMHEGGRAFQRLHEVGLQRVFQQYGHGAGGADILRGDRLSVAGIGDDNSADALFEIIQITRQTEDRHHF